jgi:ribosomal protein S4
VELTPQARELTMIRQNLDTLDRALPGWLEASPERFGVTVLGLPVRDQIDEAIKEQLIIELYSK